MQMVKERQLEPNLGVIGAAYICAFTLYYEDNNDQSCGDFPSRDSRLGLRGDI